MPAKRALKVFRTSAGFEDAYIAAPSQKAALDAWGAKRDLFAQGGAEIVKDPELAKAALARPGEVLRVPRGTTAEHLAAAGSSTRGLASKAEPHGSNKAPAPLKKPRPRPSRKKLDAAHEQLEQTRRDCQASEAHLSGQIEGLKAKLAEQKQINAAEVVRLQSRFDEEEQAYRGALAKWKG